MPKSFGLKQRIGSYLWRGLLIMLAPALTIWLIGIIYKMLHDWLGWLVSLFVRLIFPQPWLGPFADGDIPGFSIVAVLFTLIFIGWIASSQYWQKTLRKILDAIFEQLPGVRSIYTAIRSTVENFADPKKHDFKKSVWIPVFGQAQALAIVTQESIDATTGKKLLTVWYPHSPNPMSGMLMTFPEESVIDSGLNYQETLEVYISLGVNMPTTLHGTVANNLASPT